MWAAESGSSGRKISHKKKVNRESIEIKHTKPRVVQSRVRYLVELGCIRKDEWLYERVPVSKSRRKYFALPVPYSNINAQIISELQCVLINTPKNHNKISVDWLSASLIISRRM